VTSALLLTGRLASPAVRRKRRDTGVLFAVARIRDMDRGMPRDWTVFANELCTIERLEEMRVGEPVACSGPFYVAIDGDALSYRITAEVVLDVKRRRKPKGLIGREQRVESDECDLAPVSSVEEGLNDSVPF
jgi:hypothetical protein